MADKASFVARVRRGRTLPPTARSFSPDEWSAEFKTHLQDARDVALHDEGLWFHHALQLRWNQIDRIGVRDQPVEQALRHIATVLNEMHLRTETELKIAHLTAGANEPVGSSVAHLRIGANPANAATADMIRTSGVDTLGKAVDFIRSNPPSSRLNRFDKAVMHAAYRLFEDIYLLEYLWGRTLWLGWTMGRRGNDIRFQPPAPDLAGTSSVISEWWWNNLHDEFITVYGVEWSTPGSLLPPTWDVVARKYENRYVFSAFPRMPPNGQVSHHYVLREMLSASELYPYLERPLPKVKGAHLTLAELICAWELLALAGVALIRLLTRGKTASGPRSAPVLTIADLSDLVGALGWPRDKCAAAVRFFVLESQSLDGMWMKPFLPIGGNRVIPILTPLTSPNLFRVTELWVTEAMGDHLFAERGRGFEAKLRQEIAGAIAKRRWSSRASVLTRDWDPKIDKVPRDIDLVVRVDQTVFVGELKLKKHPVSAAEIGRHIEEFHHAAEQLDIRIPYLRSHLHELAAKTGYRGAANELRVVGFIVTGTQFGSGTSVGGYPVIDRDCLTFFFNNDDFLARAVIDRESGYVGRATRPVLAIPLVDDDPAICCDSAWKKDPV